MSLSVDIEKKFETFELNVSFEAGSEVLGFLGASGCGKSLTLRCIAGIETPDEGKIVVNGTTFFERVNGKRPTINLTPQQRKSALLFQNYQLFPNLTVAQNIAAGIPQTTDRASIDTIVNQQLKRFGLQEKASHYPMQLSGGQQQRVALARMIAAKPSILMLDEPFSALDSHLKSSLELGMSRVFEEFEGTVLYVSHDIDEAFRFCDRIAVVDDGHISDLGPKLHFIDNPQSLAALRLSGCRNTAEVHKVNDHCVDVPAWGIRLHTQRCVADDVRFCGVRAFMLEKGVAGEENTYKARVVRVNDSRFDSVVALRFCDTNRTPPADSAFATDSACPTRKNNAASSSVYYSSNAAEDVAQEIDDFDLQWRVNTLGVDRSTLPQEGEELYLRIPPERVYLTNR